MYTLINMVDLFPFGIIKAFFSAFAVYNILYSLQKSKFNSILTFLLIFAARVASYSLQMIDITSSVYMLIIYSFDKLHKSFVNSPSKNSCLLKTNLPSDFKSIAK